MQRLALEPHAVGDVLGGRVPGLPVAAGAPQQPAPGAVAVAVAGGEVLDLGGVAAAGAHRAEQLLGVVGVHELGDRPRLQFLARPAEQLLPGRVQEREAAVERDRREQVAGHLEQLAHARVGAPGPVAGAAAWAGWRSIGRSIGSDHVGRAAPSPARRGRGGRMDSRKAPQSRRTAGRASGVQRGLVARARRARRCRRPPAARRRRLLAARAGLHDRARRRAGSARWRGTA